MKIGFEMTIIIFGKGMKSGLLRQIVSAIIVRQNSLI
jgi:hypothetical protein